MPRPNETELRDVSAASTAADTELLSVVVPVRDEAPVLEAFHERVTTVLSGLAPLGYELIFVDDGSRDDSFDRLAKLADQDAQVRVLKLSRNFGHEIAIAAGIDAARGDAVILIDADLQDPPEVIPTMVERWREGYDVAYGTRTGRSGEGLFRRATAKVFYRLLDTLAGIDIPNDTGDFRLMSRRTVDELKALREQDRYFRGLVSWVGFKQISVPYQRAPRFAGRTKYSASNLTTSALTGITSFSTRPLRMASWLGALIILFALLGAGGMTVGFLVGRPVQTWMIILFAVALLGGVQLACVGILGEYIGRILEEVKRRPMYVLEERIEPAERDEDD